MAEAEIGGATATAPVAKRRGRPPAAATQDGTEGRTRTPTRSHHAGKGAPAGAQGETLQFTWYRGGALVNQDQLSILKKKIKDVDTGSPLYQREQFLTMLDSLCVSGGRVIISSPRE